MISRMSLTPVREAASSSRTSTCRPWEIATQCSQVPQGEIVGSPLPSGPIQFMPLAMIRAVVVFPVPRMPVRMKPGRCGQPQGTGERAHHGVLADKIGKGLRAVFPCQYLVLDICAVGHGHHA